MQSRVRIGVQSRTEPALHAWEKAVLTALVQNPIATYKALGGGWDAPTEVAAGEDR